MTTRYNWNEPAQQTKQRIASALERIADALEATATPAGLNIETFTITSPDVVVPYPPVPAPRASHEVKRPTDLNQDHTRLEDIG